MCLNPYNESVHYTINKTVDTTQSYIKSNLPALFIISLHYPFSFTISSKFNSWNWGPQLSQRCNKPVPCTLYSQYIL